MRVAAFVLLLLFQFLLNPVVGLTQNDSIGLKLKEAAELKAKDPVQSRVILHSILSQNLPDSLLKEANYNLGLTFYFSSKLDSALYYLTTALLVGDKDSAERINLDLHNALGVIHQSIGNYKKATDHYLTALHLSEELENKTQIAKIFNNLSALYRVSQDLTNARNYAVKAIEIYSELGDSNSLAGSINNLGLVYYALNEFDSAQMSYERSLKLKEKFHSDRSIANTINNLGMVAMKNDDLKASMTFHRSAMLIRKASDDLFGTTSSYLNLASTYALMNQVDSAWRYVKLAEPNVKQLNTAELVIRLHRLKADLYESQGELKLAVEELKQLNDARDSIWNDDLYRQLTRAEYDAAESDARMNSERVKREVVKEKSKNERQRLISLILAITMAIFIGMSSLLLYQLTQLRRLRSELMKDRDDAKLDSDRRKSMLNQAAHEIRTPIHGIEAIADFIQDEEDESERKQMLGILKLSTGRLLRLSENLLNLSRIEYGKISVNHAPLNLVNWIEQELPRYRLLAEQRGLKLNYNRESDQLPIVSDPDLMAQIVTNLIGNAIKYTDEGSVTISCGVEKAEAYISIRDTGRGIKREKQEKIFEEFESDESGSDSFGLGLSIVKTYTKILDGRVTINSEEGKGSTFTVYFPLSDQA